MSCRLAAFPAAIACFALTALPPIEPSARASDEIAKCSENSDTSELQRANDNVQLQITELPNGARLEAVNLRPLTSEMLISDKKSEDAPDRAIALPPLSTTTVFELDGVDKVTAQDKWRARWGFRSHMGSPPEISPTPGFLYRLPFRAGKTYRVSQGFMGKRSHQSEGSKYALDFQLEVGEPVHAARSGIVVRAVDWFCKSGGRELINQVNLIVIRHDDGTMAHYVHLSHKGVLVREGDRVKRGQHIGFVGMTGFTRGPHLHFVVRKERDIAIPIRFEGYEDRDLSKRGRFKVP